MCSISFMADAKLELLMSSPELNNISELLEWTLAGPDVWLAMRKHIHFYTHEMRAKSECSQIDIDQ